ncbi:hypothetical protein G5714_002834 [Onychostoma macrolepis]|uniref:Uncharacterized protein n=1 Tax=Onychostoma macrolepis TaxID=369639 RepID=A0A7J6D8I9_9TELE|nr:hypothetical protein G5714_002834 [Onychostoma macrolepis]
MGQILVHCSVNGLLKEPIFNRLSLWDVADPPIGVQEELAQEVLKIYQLQKDGSVTDVGIVIEGITVLNKLHNLSRACCYLLMDELFGSSGIGTASPGMIYSTSLGLEETSSQNRPTTTSLPTQDQSAGAAMDEQDETSQQNRDNNTLTVFGDI